MFLVLHSFILILQVNAKDLSDQKSLDKQYVYLRASSNTPGFQFNDEIKVLVSYRNTMVFIQTDKPIYNPGKTGKYESQIWEQLITDKHRECDLI